MSKAPFIWYGDGLVPHDEARIHVLTPTVKYGINVFEGLRCYASERSNDMLVFRMPEHLARLQESMRMMRYGASYSIDHLRDVVLRTIRANEARIDTHIRLSAYVLGEGTMDMREPVALMCALNVGATKPIDKRVVRAQVSSWRRVDDAAMPPRIKNAANYSNGRLAQMQARDDGYDEAIMLTRAGTVAEGPAACVFLVKDGVVMTPPTTASILDSITRRTLIELLRKELSIEVVEREIDRTELYTADEAFFCGSAYEVTPIVAVDRLQIGDGAVGKVSRAIWDSYEAVVRGRNERWRSWATPVYAETAAAPARAH